MTAGWLLLPSSSLPESNDWLGPEEAKTLAGLRLPKRRAEWRLGRLAAKRALASLVDVDELRRIQIVAAEDGAPDAFIDGRPIDLRISISHRDDVAACAVVPDGRVGCDLEAIEPRTQGFIDDFFTAGERASIEETNLARRNRHVALIWSAKESVLKALRVGLRRDTRSVEVEVEAPESDELGWHRFHARSKPENQGFEGLWRPEEKLVLTLVTEPQRRPARLHE
jgi:4'-phosphopantetheinyl transferase